MNEDTRLDVDRPRPDKFEYKGVPVTISYGYADKSTSVPFEARISFGTDNATPTTIKGDVWSSYSQAQVEAKQFARDQIDRQLG